MYLKNVYTYIKAKNHIPEEYRQYFILNRNY